jgi:hypothetical protein
VLLLLLLLLVLCQLEHVRGRLSAACVHGVRLSWYSVRGGVRGGNGGVLYPRTALSIAPGSAVFYSAVVRACVELHVP